MAHPGTREKFAGNGDKQATHEPSKRSIFPTA